MKRTTIALHRAARPLGAAAVGCIALAASAHEGHGLPGDSHWHATDVFGVVLAVASAAALLWWRNRK
jgi:hypothetical protein